jgi:hypothetical protein
MKKVLILTVFAISVSIMAQAPAPQPTGILTKEESLALENIQLRSTIINQEIAQLQALTKETRESIEKAHPGYTLGQTPQGFQLIKTPEPPKAEKKKEATPVPSPKK